MVSGSDPQDGAHPEEYPVEVFTPLYLRSGLPQPTFNLSNTDWGYGESVTFNITSNSTVSTNETKISLLGAVVSTHGKPMGQRTIFPEFSCNFTTNAGFTNSTSNSTGNFSNPLGGNSTRNFTSPSNFIGNLSGTSNFTSNSSSTDPGIDDVTLAETVIQVHRHCSTQCAYLPIRLIFVVCSRWTDVGNWPAFSDFDVPGFDTIPGSKIRIFPWD